MTAADLEVPVREPIGSAAMNEWDNELDRKHWIDPESGLDCLIVRNVLGALCGYVGVPRNHPWHGQSYDDVDVEIHGGLTFAGSCYGKICHDEHAERVANADVWWLGFDCAHFRDIVPGMAHHFQLSPLGESYKNIAYVEAECRSLAAQVKAAA